MEIEKHVVKESFAIKFIANDGKVPVGRVFIYILYNDLHEEPFALIEDLFVDSEYRHKGIGRQLMERAIEEAKNNTCYKVICTSRHGRDELHAWYEKFGFVKHGHEFRINL